MPISTASEDRDRREELAEAVRAASEDARPLRIVGGDTKRFYGRPVEGEPLSLAGHRGVLSYDPSELVITARSGTPLIEIEASLAAQRQRLAFEPLLFGGASTLGGCVAAGLAGARRPFAGAVRDSVLGVTVMNGRGEALRLGGTVFKNVAGFDAFRLMAGAQGCLGPLLDVSLRVAPDPAHEIAVALAEPWERSRPRLIALMRRPTPLSGALHDGKTLHLRLSGAKAGVAALAQELGGEPEDPSFWRALRERRLAPLDANRLWRLVIPMGADTSSVEPLGGALLRDWAGAELWLATDAPPARVRAAAVEAGGHATLFRGAAAGEETFAPLPPALLSLHQRIKAAFDPARVFNPGRMYEGL